MASTPMPARGGRPVGGSRRLLALAGDRRLADLVRAGNEAAFEVVFERHGPPLLSFCRQMLGSHEEAEDAVQQTFDSAYRALLRSDRPLVLKPWLYAIARNRCISMLRLRRAEPAELDERAGPPLAEELEHRADLRELLHDLGDLPEQQRAALVLSELGDLSHAEIAEVLGCQAPHVKGIVFRARVALAQRREGRHAPCEEIREELATVSRGALRRSPLRHHLRECESCAAFGDEVRRQRSLMALTLPALPSAALKASVLGSAGASGSAVGGALTAGSAGGLSGLGGVVSAGSGALTKVALATLVAGGVGAAGGAISHRDSSRAAPESPPGVLRGATRAATHQPATMLAPRRSMSSTPASGGTEPGRPTTAVRPSAGRRKGPSAGAVGRSRQAPRTGASAQGKSRAGGPTGPRAKGPGSPPLRVRKVRPDRKVKPIPKPRPDGSAKPGKPIPKPRPGGSAKRRSIP